MKGVGGMGVTGAAGAVADAWHATGIRWSVPGTLDRLIEPLSDGSTSAPTIASLNGSSARRLLDATAIGATQRSAVQRCNQERQDAGRSGVSVRWGYRSGSRKATASDQHLHRGFDDLERPLPCTMIEDCAADHQLRQVRGRDEGLKSPPHCLWPTDGFEQASHQPASHALVGQALRVIVNRVGNLPGATMAQVRNAC